MIFKAASPVKSIVETPLEQLEKATEKMAAITVGDKKEPKNDYHWMVYKQEETPGYIVEAKKRLGQIKQPHVAPNQVNEKPPRGPEKVRIKEDPVIIQEAEKARIGKHWMQWDNPRTPENISDIRRRLGDDRYKKNYSLAYMRSHTASPVNHMAPKSESTVPRKEEIAGSTGQEIRIKEEEIQTVDADLETNGVKYLVSYEPQSEYTHSSFKTNLPYYHQIAHTFNYFDQQPSENIEHELNNLESGNETKFILPADDNEKTNINLNQKNNSVPFQTWLKSADDQGCRLESLRKWKFILFF